VRLVLADGRDSRVRAGAESTAAYVRDYVRDHGLAVECWGPNVCPLGGCGICYRYELLLRADSAGVLVDAMQRLRHEPAFRPKVKQFMIDVDPISLL